MVQSLGGAGASLAQIQTELNGRNLNTLTERQARVSQAASINTDIIPASSVFWHQTFQIDATSIVNGNHFIKFNDGTNLGKRGTNWGIGDPPTDGAYNIVSLFFSSTIYVRVTSDATAGSHIWARQGWSWGSGTKFKEVYDLSLKYSAKREIILGVFHDNDGRYFDDINSINYDMNRIVFSVSLDEPQFDGKTGKKVANSLDEHIKANLQEFKRISNKQNIGVKDKNNCEIGIREFNIIAKEIGVSII